MSDGVRVDIIYFQTASDWLFESELYSKYYSLRLLTATASSKAETVRALGRALTRSETVVVVGGWQEEAYLPATIAKAVGVSCQRVGLAGSAPEDAVLLPSGAMPLAVDGRIHGAILCRGPQAIVLLDDVRACRAALAKAYIAPYLIKQAGLVQEKPVRAEGAVEKSEKAAAVPTPKPQPRAEKQHAEKAPQQVPQGKAAVEELAMERLRPNVPKEKKAVGGLPKLKFESGLSFSAKNAPKEEKPIEEKPKKEKPMQAHAESVVRQSEDKAPIGTNAEQVAEPTKNPPEKVQPKPKKAKVSALRRPKAESVAEPSPLQPQGAQKKEKSPVPAAAEREKAPRKAAPSTAANAKAAPKLQGLRPRFFTRTSDQNEAEDDAQDGMELPKLNRPLRVLCVLVLLAALAAALYMGYVQFVQGGAAGEAAAAALMNSR